MLVTSLPARGLPAGSVRSRSLVVLALLAASPALAAQSITIPDSPGPRLAGSLRGEEALARMAAMPGGLSGMAADVGRDAAGLTALLRRDQTLWLSPAGRLFYADGLPTSPEDGSASGFAGSIPTEDAFLLSSRPGADKTIYLDFTGHHSKNNDWNHDIVFPAFNTSGSSSSFSSSELESIIAHWQHVAEDFAAWDVNVTTADPGVDALKKNTVADQVFGVRCLLTQPTGGFGDGVGGIAFLGSFDDMQDTPVFVFNKGDNDGSMSASHEVGHAFGMSHDGLGGSEYHPGTGSGVTSWGPIMGAPFGKSVVHFSNGDYSGATNTENDMAFVTQTSNGVALLADDFPDTVAGAGTLPVACPEPSLTTVNGLIRRNIDKDALRFSTSGGTVSISVVPTVPGPNLDVLLELYTAAGALVASSNPTSDVNASLTQGLAAGTYVVLIDGTGKSGVYSDFGSIGTYALTVSAPAASSLASVGGGLAGTGGVPALVGTGVACEGNAVTLGLTGAFPNSTAWLALGFGQANVPFKGGVLIPDIAAPGGFLPVPTSGSGAFSLPTAWPAGVPAGTVIDFQAWTQDPGGPVGFSASNGVELVTP